MSIPRNLLGQFMPHFESRRSSGTLSGASTVGTNTTVVCPAVTGVIWRVNAFYRLGLQWTK